MPLPKLPTRPAEILDLKTMRATAPQPAEIEEVRPPRLSSMEAILSKSKRSTATEKLSPASPALKQVARPAIVVTEPAVQAPVARAPGAPTKTPSRAPAVTPVARQNESTDTPAVATPTRAASGSKRNNKKSGDNASRKMFVLDTNVLLHDPSSLYRFEEHDIFLPMMTLEELDHQKKGMSEVARNARQVSRALDILVGDQRNLEEGLRLDSQGNKDATGRLFFQTTAMASTLPPDLPMGKADNQILGVVRALQDLHKTREVVLVSKDINMRLKARTLSLAAEDYFNDQVLEDSDLLYSGVLQLPENFWNKHGKDVESWQQGGTTFYKITGPMCGQFIVNQFVYF